MGLYCETHDCIKGISTCAQEHSVLTFSGIGVGDIKLVEAGILICLKTHILTEISI